MARAVASDPQLRLPDRPKLVEGIVCLPVDHGLLVEGAAERQVFRGRTASTVLPGLLRLLDGSRGIRELAARAELSPSVVHAVLALLHTRGVLEEGTEGEPAADDPLVRAFLSRTVDSTRVNRSGAEAAARIRRARVLVLGERGAALAEELTAIGITARRGAAGSGLEGGLSLVVTTDFRFFDRSALDDACAAAGIAWLNTTTIGNAVEIGPLFDARHTACWRCSHVSEAPATTSHLSDDLLAAAHIALAAAEVVAITTRITPLQSLRGVVCTDVAGWAQRRRLVSRQPGCPRCCPIPPDIPTPRGVGYRFEQSVEFPPVSLLNPKEHLQHYKPANIRLQRASRRLPPAPRSSLPDLADLPPPRGRRLDGSLEVRSTGRLDLSMLGAVLGRVAGLRRTDGRSEVDKVQRWAPTGGNLGSPQLTVVVGEVDGLDPGFYAYVGTSHELVDLGGDEERVERFGDAHPLGHAPVILILTAALDRMASKYGSSAYRLVHLDAGCAITQLRVVAAGYGLRADVAARWVDHLIAEQLGLTLDREPVTGVVALHTQALDGC